MSNTENKNEQIIKGKIDIDKVNKNINKFISNVNDSKNLIKESLNKINAIKQSKIDAVSNDADSTIMDKKPEIVKKEAVTLESSKVDAVVANKTETVVESKAESKTENSTKIVENNDNFIAVQDSTIQTKVENKVNVEPKTSYPKTYINQEVMQQEKSNEYKANQQGQYNRNQNRDYKRDGSQNNQGGRTYNNQGNQSGQRPYNNQGGQGSQRTYNNQGGQTGQRPYNSQGGQTGQRPYNSQGGQGGQRPYNNQGARPGNNTFGTGGKPTTSRPFGAKPAPIMPAPSFGPKKDTTKKKITSNQKDDNKKTFNKRDLLKRGYHIDDSLLNDGAPSRYVKSKKQKKEMFFAPQPVVIQNAVFNFEIIPIKVFSEKIGKTATEIVKKLFDMGKIATINDNISFEDAEFIALDYGITLELTIQATAEDKIAEIVSNIEENKDNLVKRPPVVAIMGHVDHGKTSLLDYIRKANVVQKEAGGITQHIGAYTIELNNERITFLDTPGHEAFTSMRRRGAKVTDIAIIVVAADDGVMPQTVEAINHAKEAGVAIIVAVNKIDKTDGNIDKIKQQLSNYDLLAEDWGGQTMVCPVSAKKGIGVKELLENVLLLSEVMELKANKKCAATGSIIEARLDKGIGPVATVLVRNGTLKVKDYIVAGTAIGKVRAMTDHLGKRLKEATPSMAVQIQGFAEVPNAGDIMVVVADEKLAKQVAQERENKERSERTQTATARSLDDMFKNADSQEIKTLTLLIKADVQGSAEAVKQSMIKLSDELAEENVKIHIVHTGVGAISESDVLLADTTNAIIIGFNVRPDPNAKALAEKYGVDIRNYSIIYAAIDDITKALKGMFTPKYKENIIGHAEIRAVFKLSTHGVIAGSYITDGKVVRNASARVLRDNIVVYEGKISSLRREKDDAREVNTGYECGIGLDKFDTIKVGDIIECFIMEKLEK